MALAPTLLKIKNVSIGVGLVTLAGLAVTNETGQRGPTAGLVTIVGNIPTISVQAGPQAEPDIGGVSIVGQIPFLQRILFITTGLPDATPELNDLTPILVWQETTQPTQGFVTLGGLAPAIVGDTGQSIAVSVGSAIIQGLVPTLVVPSGQEGTAAPDKAEMAVTGFEPFMLGELTVSPEQAVITIGGFVPSFSARVGWTDVGTAANQGWQDVPTV